MPTLNFKYQFTYFQSSIVNRTTVDFRQWPSSCGYVPSCNELNLGEMMMLVSLQVGVGVGSISLINFSESCWIYQFQVYIRNCKELNVL